MPDVGLSKMPCGSEAQLLDRALTITRRVKPDEVRTLLILISAYIQRRQLSSVE